ARDIFHGHRERPNGVRHARQRADYRDANGHRGIGGARYACECCRRQKHPGRGEECGLANQTSHRCTSLKDENLLLVQGKAQLRAIRSGCEPPPFELFISSVRALSSSSMTGLSQALSRLSKTLLKSRGRVRAVSRLFLLCLVTWNSCDRSGLGTTWWVRRRDRLVPLPATRSHAFLFP